MSNELTITINALLRNNGADVSFTPQQLRVNQTAQGFHHSVVSVGTASEQIDFGDLVEVGYCFAKNLSDTYYVDIGTVVGSGMDSCITLRAGEIAAFRIGTSGLYAYSNGANTLVEFLILED